MLTHFRFDNRLIQELPQDPVENSYTRQVRNAIWSLAPATTVKAPVLLAWSPAMAQELGIRSDDIQDLDFADVFAGNKLLPGMRHYATRYGGHQFGHWAGQLGDGRAIYLGEVITDAGKRWELQLKGAGSTPYSRRADGRAVLRSSLREFLCSEAMFYLGVPTTRVLSLVNTGEVVLRDMLYDGNPADEPGSIVCRVAPSFLRFGHYEILSHSGEIPLLEKLVDFTLSRDFPQLEGDVASKRQQWFKQICQDTAILMAHWMRVGFVHGVMNTDNMSILGLTIDYGPYGWIDNFDPNWTPNTTDRQNRRYRFGQQPQIGLWNLACLAEALGPLFDGTEALEAALESYTSTFAEHQARFTAAKFGFDSMTEIETELVEQAYGLMQLAEVDMTIFFRSLATVDRAKPVLTSLQDAFYDLAKYEQYQDVWQGWLEKYTGCLPVDPVQLAKRHEQMNQTNPCYVLRNYLAQEAIDLAEKGDTTKILELQAALSQPYTPQSQFQHLAQKRPDWARQRAGCSMLSCSS